MCLIFQSWPIRGRVGWNVSDTRWQLTNVYWINNGGRGDKDSSVRKSGQLQSMDRGFKSDCRGRFLGIRACNKPLNNAQLVSRNVCRGQRERRTYGGVWVITVIANRCPFLRFCSEKIRCPILPFKSASSSWVVQGMVLLVVQIIDKTSASQLILTSGVLGWWQSAGIEWVGYVMDNLERSIWGCEPIRQTGIMT